MKPVTLAFIFLARISLAQFPAVEADRPDQTETAALVPQQHFQMEAGFVFEDDREVRAFSHPSVLLKYGVLENLEIRLILQSQTIVHHDETVEKNSGILPVEAGLKIGLFDERKARPQAALIGHAGLSFLASKSYKTEFMSFNFRFAFNHSLAKRWSLGYNAGMEWNGESARPQFIYTLAPGVAITEKLGAFAELYGFIPQKSSAQHFFDGGFTFRVKNNLMLDASAGVSISTPLYYFAGCGVSFRLPD